MQRALKLQDPFTNLRSGGPITVKNVRCTLNGENIHLRARAKFPRGQREFILTCIHEEFLI